MVLDVRGVQITSLGVGVNGIVIISRVLALRLVVEAKAGLVHEDHVLVVADREADVTIDAKADFVNGIDFTVQAQPPETTAVPSKP